MKPISRSFFATGAPRWLAAAGYAFDVRVADVDKPHGGRTGRQPWSSGWPG